MYRGPLKDCGEVYGYREWKGSRIWFLRPSGGAYVGWDPDRNRWVVTGGRIKLKKPFRGTWRWKMFA